MNAIVLGGTEDHIRLIEILKNRGYFVYLIDYHKNPPAATHADIHLQCSTLDQDKIIEIAKEKEAKLIISACIDHTLKVAAYVSEQLGLSNPFTYEQALNVTVKSRMKKILCDNNIPTSKYILIKEDIDENEVNRLSFPLIIKPVDSNGSAGIRVIRTMGDLNFFFAEAKKISPSGLVILEEFKEGLEVNVDAFIGNDGIEVMMYGNVRKCKMNEHVNLIFQTIIPAPISEKALTNIKNIIGDIAVAFNLKNTPILLQVIVSGDEVNVIEFSPRIGGASKHKTIFEFSKFDMLNALVDSYLNKTVCNYSGYKNPLKYSRNHLYAQPGIFDHIIGVEELIEKEVIIEFSSYKTNGMEIGNNYASKDRIGSFLTRSESYEKLNKNIEQAVNTIKVYNQNGEEILNRDIFKGIHF